MYYSDSGNTEPMAYVIVYAGGAVKLENGYFSAAKACCLYECEEED